tara:strand:+ start:1579 stop:1821 length:243 start_codon:yes stop_codon:yes gene_type:complete
MSDTYELEAKYEVHSCYLLEFNIKDVYAWWMKYDTLYVQHEIGGPVTRYTPTFSGRKNDFKHAVAYYQNAAPVEENPLKY